MKIEMESGTATVFSFFLAIAIIVCFVFADYLHKKYIEKVIEKTSKNVNVRKTEWLFLIPIKRVLFLLTMSFFLFCSYTLIMEWIESGVMQDVGVLVVFIIIIIVCILGLLRYLKRPYWCIPVSDALDANILRESLEQESFHKIDTGVWESKYWVRIGRYFFPKNVILSASESFNKYIQYVEMQTVMGKKYKFSEDRKIFPGKSLNRQFTDLFPFEKMLFEYELRSTHVCDAEKNKEWFAKCYSDYMSCHDTEDLITDTELIEQCAQKIIHF